MKLINALCHHAWLVLSLQHDGKGMPKQVPAAFLLALSYCLLAVINTKPHEVQFETVCCLLFIAQFYVFLLRNALIGLLVMIGVVTNGLHLIIANSPTSPEFLLLLSVFEYVMVFCAIINVIKSEYQMN